MPTISSRAAIALVSVDQLVFTFFVLKLDDFGPVPRLAASLASDGAVRCLASCNHFEVASDGLSDGIFTPARARYHAFRDQLSDTPGR